MRRRDQHEQEAAVRPGQRRHRRRRGRAGRCQHRDQGRHGRGDGRLARRSAHQPRRHGAVAQQRHLPQRQRQAGLLREARDHRLRRAGRHRSHRARPRGRPRAGPRLPLRDRPGRQPAQQRRPARHRRPGGLLLPARQHGAQRHLRLRRLRPVLDGDGHRHHPGGRPDHRLGADRHRYGDGLPARCPGLVQPLGPAGPLAGHRRRRADPHGLRPRGAVGQRPAAARSAARRHDPGALRGHRQVLRRRLVPAAQRRSPGLPHRPRPDRRQLHHPPRPAGRDLDPRPQGGQRRAARRRQRRRRLPLPLRGGQRRGAGQRQLGPR